MIHRSEHSANFTVISNEILEDRNLSAEAFRLLVFMLSCSDEWKFSLRGLSYCFDVTERTVSAWLSELKSAGYVAIKWSTGENGHFQASEWEVYEEPNDAISTAWKNNRNAVKLQDGSPRRSKTASRSHRTAVAPQRGNASTLKQISIETNTNNKQILKETNTKGTRVFKKPTYDEVSAYCQERQNSIDPQQFIDHYESNGWKVGKNPMKDWRAAVRTWEKRDYNKPSKKPEPIFENPFTKMLREEGYI